MDKEKNPRSRDFVSDPNAPSEDNAPSEEETPSEESSSAPPESLNTETTDSASNPAHASTEPDSASNPDHASTEPDPASNPAHASTEPDPAPEANPLASEASSPEAQAQQATADLDAVAAARIDELKQIVKKNAEQHKKTIKTLKETRKTVRRNYHGMVQLLIEIISLGNRYLGGHLKRCAETSWHFCKYMQMPKDICYLHYYATLLHDIGLIGKDPALSEVPPEQFTDEQRAEFQQHPLYGQHIISAVYNLKRTAAIIRSHHERYDGHGFPDHLQGKSIPLGARVVRIVNDWDNLIYKYNLKVEEAVETISSGSGTIYDPKITARFITFAPNWIKDRESQGERIMIDSLAPGMYLKDDILLTNGLMLVPHGMILDQATIDKIHSFQSMIEGDHTFTVV